VRAWSSQVQGEWQPIEHAVRVPIHWVRWCLAAAALVLMAAVPIQKSRLDREREAELDRADALLMERVDAAVSRAVPRPMEPLMRLISIEGEVR